MDNDGSVAWVLIISDRNQLVDAYNYCYVLIHYVHCGMKKLSGSLIQKRITRLIIVLPSRSYQRLSSFVRIYESRNIKQNTKFVSNFLCI